MSIQVGQALSAFGWIFMVLGIGIGAFTGTYAFAGPMNPPEGHESYSSLPRRLLRLAHIAAIMLPLITIVYSAHIDSVALDQSWRLVGAYSMVTATIGIPMFLVIAMFYNAAKYAEVIPVSAMFLGLGIIAWGYLNTLLF